MNILFIPAEGIDAVDKLSQNTRERCDAGFRAWQTGNFDLVLVTGGKFLKSEVQRTPAASLMRRCLISRGVPAEKILAEVESLDTYENISMELSVLKKCGISMTSVMIVTQYQHALRFIITFWLEHDMRVKVIPIRHRKLSWKHWLMEWLVLIPYHLLDRDGSGWFARINREKRQRDATQSS